jgi:hypothetical protein
VLLSELLAESRVFSLLTHLIKYRHREVAKTEPLDAVWATGTSETRRRAPTVEEPLRSGQPATHGCHQGGVEE